MNSKKGKKVHLEIILFFIDLIDAKPFISPHKCL